MNPADELILSCRCVAHLYVRIMNWVLEKWRRETTPLKAIIANIH